MLGPAATAGLIEYSDGARGRVQALLPRRLLSGLPVKEADPRGRLVMEEEGERECWCVLVVTQRWMVTILNHSTSSGPSACGPA
jgi:hypothetical protein